MPAAPYVVRTGAARRSASAATAAAASRAPPPTQSSGRSAPSRAAIAAARSGDVGEAGRGGGEARGGAGRRDFGGQQVGRDLEVRRAGRGSRSRTRRPRRPRPRRRPATGRVDGLDDGREHLRLAGGLVQDAPVLADAPQRRRDVGRDDQHRRARRPRLTHGAQGVRRAWPRGGQRHAQPARGPRVAVRRVRRRLLVPHTHEPDRRRAQRLPQGEVVHARQPEAHLHSGPLELRHDDLRSRGHRPGTLSDRIAQEVAGAADCGRSDPSHCLASARRVRRVVRRDGDLRGHRRTRDPQRDPGHRGRPDGCSRTAPW